MKILRVLFALSVGSAVTVSATAQNFDCTRDVYLERAAKLLSERPQTSGVYLRTKLQEWGSDVSWFAADVGVHVDAGVVRELIEEEKIVHASQVRCGIHESRGRYAAVVTPDLGSLQVVVRDQSAVVHAAWHAGFDAARLYIRYRTDKVEKVLLKGTAQATYMAKNAAAIASVQLLADGVQGPQVIGARYFDAANNTALHIDNAAVWIKTLRTKTKRVQRYPLLDTIASEHAQAICQYGKATHDTGEGRLAYRLRRHGFVASLSGEVVSRAESFADALDSLAQSPAHYMTLVDKRFSAWGVGTAKDADGVQCVVLALASPKHKNKR